MARYKRIDTSPRFLAVDLSKQLLPGSLEHALNYLIDHEVDISSFDARYHNSGNLRWQSHVGDRQGLIGREMFAIDGVKLPSNASKAKSGTRAEFERQAVKLDTAVATLLARHREADANDAVEPDPRAKEVKRINHLKRDAGQIRDWLTAHPDERKGSKGGLRKSNRTAS